MADQIPRIEAHQQRLNFQVAACAQDGKAAGSLLEAIDGQIGQVVSTPKARMLSEKPEPGAFDILRSLSF